MLIITLPQVRFSERRALREREEEIMSAFNCLTELEHPNIVKLHSYWVDADKRRVGLVGLVGLVQLVGLRLVQLIGDQKRTAYVIFR